MFAHLGSVGQVLFCTFKANKLNRDPTLMFEEYLLKQKKIAKKIAKLNKQMTTI